MQLTSRQKIIIGVSASVLIVVGILFSVFWTEESVSDTPVPDIPVVTESDDDIRIRHLELIKKSIPAAIARGVILPMPADALKIDFNGSTLVYQWKTDDSLFDLLGLNTLLDPKTQKPYEYVLSSDGLKYQIIAVLDDEQRSNTTLRGIYAVGEPELFIRDKNGQVITRAVAGSDVLDISVSAERQKVGLETFKSCQEIHTFSKSIIRPKSGVYTIDIGGRDTKVYCDMQTDGGGWTLFYANNGHEDSPIAKSYVQMRETMTTEPILDLSNYDDPNLAGLLDFNHFITGGSKEILIRNRTGDVKKWVKFTFSTSRALNWGLWPAVLGKTELGCIDVPRKATWSIINNDKKIMYENLTQMMNHGGLSWGVSHDKYLCNGSEVWKTSLIGFYNANSSKSSERARSNDGIGGKWGDGNEYRYFIR